MKQRTWIKGCLIFFIALIPFFIYRLAVTEKNSTRCSREELMQHLQDKKSAINNIIMKEILFNLVLTELKKEIYKEANNQ